MLTIERLKELLSYNPTTGELIHNFSRGGRRKGSSAGCRRKDGYVMIRLDNVLYLRHRLVWLFHTGIFPDLFIDHINRIPGDDRFENLRQSTQSENLCNTKMQTNNTSGHRGVSWHKEKSKWRAYGDGGKQKFKHLGYFINLEDAVGAAVNYRVNTQGDFYNPHGQYNR